MSQTARQRPQPNAVVLVQVDGKYMIGAMSIAVSPPPNEDTKIVDTSGAAGTAVADLLDKFLPAPGLNQEPEVQAAEDF